MLLIIGDPEKMYMAQIASTRCMICHVKGEIIDHKTIYCKKHGYMDRGYEEGTNKNINLKKEEH